MDAKRFCYHSEYTYYLKDDFERIQSIIIQVKNDKFGSELVDIIELDNICSFIEKFKEAAKLTELELNNFYQDLKNRIVIFVSQRKLDSFSDEYSILPSIYKDCFWSLMLKLGVLKKVSSDEFCSFIKHQNVSMRTILHYKAISKKFNLGIKGLLLKDPKHFEIFVDKYEEIGNKVRIEFNFDFTNVELNEWARRYCMLPNANLSYLEAISKWGKHNLKKLDPEIILLAKHKYNDGLEKIFADKKGAHIFSMGVSFESGLEKDYEFKSLNSQSENFIKFNRDWLDTEQDGRTILKNFIYFFGFFNSVGQFTISASPYFSMDSFMDLFNRSSRFDYDNSIIFKYTKELFDLIFLAYFDYLDKNGNDLESVFGDFYNIFIERDYCIRGFFFNVSSKDYKFYDRCKLVIPEMDSILRQFVFFVKDKEINMELFELSSGDVNYNEIPSLSKKKFVYFNSQNQIDLCNLLFSTNSFLIRQNSKNNYSNFFELVRNGVTLNDFDEFQVYKIEKIISENILQLGVGQNLYFTNLNEIEIFQLIWQRGYISTMNLSESLNQTIQAGVDSGKLKYEGLLFSKEDMNYISYILDDQKYNDSLKIRNKLTHGSYSKKKDKEYKIFYLNLLGIVLLYTYRIDEELDWYARKKQSGRLEDTN
ncbi:hypothetical protein JNUCC76_06750 [Leuconostoc sp. JNUCC 76]